MVHFTNCVRSILSAIKFDCSHSPRIAIAASYDVDISDFTNLIEQALDFTLLVGERQIVTEYAILIAHFEIGRAHV